MADLLVKLYDLKPAEEVLERLRANGVEVRRALSTERDAVLGFAARFSPGWRSECEVGLSRQPASCFVAVEVQPRTGGGYPRTPELLVGFACYDATCRGFFGPFGVREDRRGRDIGTALLLRTLVAMREDGYGYAIIGWAGPVAFFERTVGATLIDGSEPGVHRAPLKLD